MFRFYFKQYVVLNVRVRSLKTKATRKSDQSKEEKGDVASNIDGQSSKSFKIEEPSVQNKLYSVRDTNKSISNSKSLFDQTKKDEAPKEEEMPGQQVEPKTIKFEIMENLESFSIFGSEETGKYGIQSTENDNTLNIPSVTHILNETMSTKAKFALEMWKKRIIDKYGETFFKIMIKALLADGKLFHSCIKDVLMSKNAEIPARIKSAYFSVEPVLNEIKTVYAIEKFVTHPILRYKGIVDCIASYRDHVYLIDWKKSGKQKSTPAATYDAPLQLAAYIGAANASNDYPFRIDRGLVVVAYTNGEPATIHELSNAVLQKAWREWLKKLEQFYTNVNAQSCS